MFNIDELIIIYLILNYQINKHVIRVMSSYSISNRVVFEYIIFDSFIIRIMSGLTNTVKCLLLI